MKALKHTIEDEGYIESHKNLLLSDGEEQDKESHSKYESTFQSSGEEDVTQGNDVSPQMDFL